MKDFKKPKGEGETRIVGKSQLGEGAGEDLDYSERVGGGASEKEGSGAMYSPIGLKVLDMRCHLTSDKGGALQRRGGASSTPAWVGLSISMGELSAG